MLQYEIYSLLPSTKCTTCFTIKFIEKLILLNRQKIIFFPRSSIQAISKEIPLIETATIVHFLLHFFFALFLALSVALSVLREILLYFSMKFYLQVKYRMVHVKIY